MDLNAHGFVKKHHAKQKDLTDEDGLNIHEMSAELSKFSVRSLSFLLLYLLDSKSA